MTRRPSIAAVRGLALGAALALPAVARAQFPTAPPPAPVVAPQPFDSMMGRGQQQLRRDTTKDTTKVKEIVKWAEPDPVMDSLMQLPDYQVTRYQGCLLYTSPSPRD